MSREIAPELSFALRAVRSAAVRTQAVQATLDPDVVTKGDRSPVTVADYAAQAVVCRALSEAYPDDPVIAEEDGRQLAEGDARSLAEQVRRVVDPDGDVSLDAIVGWIDHGRTREFAPRFWTLDPVDGTKGFLRGQHYAIALALIVDGTVEVAALACPHVRIAGRPGGALFGAVRGQGATVQPLGVPVGGEPTVTRARVSQQARAPQLRLCESVESGHSRHDQSAELCRRMGIEAEPVRLDGQAKYGVVALGDAELYLRLPTRPGYEEKIWDHAAGVLVVEEAGGRVTDLDGRALDFRQGPTLRNNRGVVVSHGVLHDDVLSTFADMGI